MVFKVFGIFVICILCVYSEDVPVVSTTLGKIAGVYEESYKGKVFSAFYGIPFAKPPIGVFRFQDPQPMSPWSGVWNANSTDIMCAQVMHAPEPEGGSYIGDEDCLYLNVFVPSKEIASSKEFDVIVHIHGGGLMFGSSNSYTGPNYLMDKDVILVTMNYRLGVLGFLSTEDDIVPGNNGMKDQVLALKWIRDHIKSFGGNPDSVTLTGLSAGGASVHLHYFSPLSKGLFSRGVSFSGNALTPWVLQDDPLRKAQLLGTYLGCPTRKPKDLVECLKQRPIRQVVESIKIMRPWLFNPFSPLGVVVEKSGSNKFLAEHPYRLLKEGHFYDVPWITSLTSEEGLYPAADYVLKRNYLSELDERWLELAPSVLDYNYTVPDGIKDQVSRQIKDEYLKGQPISPTTYKNLIDMMSDRLFSIPAEKAAKLQAHSTKSPVYVYYFCYTGEKLESFTVHFAKQDQDDGVSHGDDMMYIFSNPHKPKPIPKLTYLEEHMKEIFINMLLSFSSTGKPVIKGVVWQPVAKDLKEPLMHLVIKSPMDISMQNADDIDRHRSMWESIPFTEDEGLLLIDKVRDDL